MSDSRGVSEKSVLHNSTKMIHPSYVTEKNISISDSLHRGGKHRNKLCPCGSGEKLKKCCGAKNDNSF